MQTLSDLQAQCQAVNLAFQKHIEETTEAKTKLEEHLEKVSLEPGGGRGGTPGNSWWGCATWLLKS